MTGRIQAVSITVNGKVTTYTLGLGTNGGIFGDIGTWTSCPPTLSGWPGYY